MGVLRWGLLLLLPALAGLTLAACSNSDDAERLAAQRLFRNFLLKPDEAAAADVRIQKFADKLPPDFPLFEHLTLLGSAFTDTATTRELIVGWESSRAADEIYNFYQAALNRDPWKIVQEPRIQGVDFLTFTDADNSAFTGELRIAQEGDAAVVVLIAREGLSGPDNVPEMPPVQGRQP